MLLSFAPASSLLHQLMHLLYQLWSPNSDDLSSSNSGSHESRKHLFKPIKKRTWEQNQFVACTVSCYLLSLSCVLSAPNANNSGGTPCKIQFSERSAKFLSSELDHLNNNTHSSLKWRQCVASHPLWWLELPQSQATETKTHIFKTTHSVMASAWCNIFPVVVIQCDSQCLNFTGKVKPLCAHILHTCPPPHERP